MFTSSERADHRESLGRFEGQECRRIVAEVQSHDYETVQAHLLVV